MVEFKLGELPTDEATDLIKALADSYSLIIDDEVIAKTLELIQWPIPYFIQLLMDRLISKSREMNNYTINIEDVAGAFNELSKSNYFMTWDERLIEYRDLESITRFILDSLSTTEKGLPKNQLLQTLITEDDQIESNYFTAERATTEENNLYIRKGFEAIPRTETTQIKNRLSKALEMLEQDGYIERNEENRRFRSPILRKWWKYRFID